MVQATHFWKRYAEEGHGTDYSFVERFGRRNGNKMNFVFGQNSLGTVIDPVSLLLLPVHLTNVSNRLRTIDSLSPLTPELYRPIGRFLR